MKICVLASGSKGNSTYVETKNHRILIDLGKNKKYIVDALKSINVDPKSIDIILISHLHSDHISALEGFVKTYKTSIYMPKEMLLSFDSIKDYEHIITYENDIDLNDIIINTIKSSHDAVDSRNFLIEEDGKSLVQITDTGYIKSKYFNLLKGKNVYLIESNHDIEMLTHGPYPAWLKRRVLSDEGHLSNNASGFYLSKLIDNNTKYIYLMHLSEVNNSPSVALNTVREALKSNNVKFNNIKCADQNSLSEVIEI